MSHPLPNASIFRAYDIRGVMEETLTISDMQQIAQAFASEVADSSGVEHPRIALVKDGRLSSPALVEAAQTGLQAAGAQVLNAGTGPTPLCYYARALFEAEGAMMITGSHNPKNHNGAKFMIGSDTLHSENIQSLYNRLQHQNLHQREGGSRTVHILKDYAEHVSRELEGIMLDKTIIWDAGNGATSNILRMLVRAISATHHQLLHCEIDGNFPNHHPDPSDPKNLEDAIHAVQQHDNAIGFVFDGDGDRLGVIDELGRPVSSDHLIMLLAREVLVDSPGGTLIADVKTSDRVFDDIRAHGGKAIMWKTGHALIKQHMKETAARFAGEASGHLFFADRYFGFDDGIYTAIRVLRLITNHQMRLCDMVDSLPILHTTPEWRLPCADAKKFTVIAEIAEHVQQQGGYCNQLDGVRVSRDHGWWLLRASNTQDVLVARAEGRAKADLVRLCEEMNQYLAPHNLQLPISN